MIFTFLLNIPAYLIAVVLALLPNGSGAPTEWVNGVYTIWADVNAFSFIVPVQTLLFCLGIAMIFHLAILGFKLFHWIITKIPFVG